MVYILLNKGFTESQIRNLIFSADVALDDFESIENSGIGADLIIKNLKQNKNILIFADYDADGITSGFVMYSGINRAREILKSSSKIKVYYPQRSEGYGLQLKYCQDNINELDMVVTVDNGIGCKEAVRYLLNNDKTVLITDHHEPGDSVPENCVIVNPCYNDTSRSHLAGVGVAYYVVRELAYKTEFRADDLLSIVAIGTISDVMPLTYENALIIKNGLDQINSGYSGYVSKFLLMAKELYCGSNNITTTNISFDIAPRLNAAGRLSNTKYGAGGFFTDKEDIIKSFLDKLEEINKERKKQTDAAKEIVKNIKIKNDTTIVMFDGSDYPKGVHGIISGKIAEKFPHIPAFVYSDNGDTISGSVRCSNENLNVLELFKAVKEQGNLVMCAGHNSACVITIEKTKLKDFYNSFSKLYSNIEIKESVLEYDLVSNLGLLNDDLLSNLNSLPITVHEQPRFLIPNVLVIEHSCSKNNPENIKFKLSDNSKTRTVWAWGFGSKYKSMGEPEVINIIGEITQDFMSKKLKSTIRIIDIFTQE